MTGTRLDQYSRSIATKHWPGDKQTEFWDWFKPYIPKVFDHSNNDLVSIWTSFIEVRQPSLHIYNPKVLTWPIQHMFFNKDPRRMQPLVDYLVKEFHAVDFNAESTFDVVKVLCFFRAFYEEMNRKFTVWADEVLKRCWPEISSEHDDVCIGRC